MPTALVIDGHPDQHSLTAAIARRYAAGHGDAELLALRDLSFDPHLRYGYHQRMTLEPDLVSARGALHAADRVVVASPLWWGSTPALLKGFFDRAFLPQQEYRFSKLGLPEGLIPANHGRLFLLADTPWYFVPFTGLPAQRQIVGNTLRLSGIQRVRTHRMLGVKNASPTRIARWLALAEEIGESDGRRDHGIRSAAELATEAHY